MRKLLLPVLFALAAGLCVVPASAQNNKDPRPGYIIIRVLLDDGGGNAPAVDPNNPNAQPQANNRPVDPMKSVAAVVPYTFIERKLFNTDKPANQLTNPFWYAFKHKYGMCYAYADKTFVQYYQVQNISFEGDLKAAYEKWSVKRSYDGIHEIVQKALMMGRYDDAQKYCDEYLKMPTLTTAPQTERYKAFAKAYTGLPEKLAKPATSNPAAEDWKTRLGATNVVQGEHYTLFGFDSNQPTEMQRRIKTLEGNFKGFFVWHALEGLALPVPAKKMLVLLSDSPNRLKDFKDGLDGLPIVSDATYSPGNDLLVLSPERLDTNGQQFFNLAKARFAAGWNRDELLRGKMPAIPAVPGKAEEATQMMMLSVADQFLIEEGDNSAISREASRQLLAATGMIPPHVRLPHWLENGLGFYFQRAKGPVYIRDNNGPLKMVVGLATGMGTPNFVYHRDYDRFKEAFNRNPAQTLLNVISNEYYQGAVAGYDADPRPAPAAGDPNNPNSVGGAPDPTPAADNDPNPDPIDPNATPEQAARRTKARLMKKADAASWALAYYLQKTRLTGMQKFYQELARLPRDMRLESDTVMKLFGKSFGLLKLDQTPDPAAIKSFAEGWLQFMNNVPHYDWAVALEGAGSVPLTIPANAAAGGPGNTGPGGGGPGPGGGGTGPGGGGPGPGGGGGRPPGPGGG